MPLVLKAGSILQSNSHHTRPILMSTMESEQVAGDTNKTVSKLKAYQLKPIYKQQKNKSTKK